MKEKAFKVLEIICESVYFLVITYTLSGMSASFDPHWYSLPFRAANLFAMIKYYESMKQLTDSKFWTVLLLVLNLLVFSLIAWKIGYIRGEFTPFTRLF